MEANNGRLWATVQNGAIEIRSLTKADLQEALDILDKSFFLGESVCIACCVDLPENVQSRKELRELCRLTADDGVSLVAKHVESGKIAAVAFNKIQYVPAKDEVPFFLRFRDEQTHSPQAMRLMNFMIEIDGQTDVFEMYNIDCLNELMFLGTLPEFKRQGLGRILTKYTIELTRELSQGIGIEAIHSSLRSKRPRAVTAIFTSQFSQKIGRNENFKVINTVSYDNYSFNGATFASRINPMHKFAEHAVYLL